MSTMRMRMTCGLLRSMAMLDPGAALKLKMDLFKGTIQKNNTGYLFSGDLNSEHLKTGFI